VLQMASCSDEQREAVYDYSEWCSRVPSQQAIYLGCLKVPPSERTETPHACVACTCVNVPDNGVEQLATAYRRAVVGGGLQASYMFITCFVICVVLRS
jgi:hypothetical protein